MFDVSFEDVGGKLPALVGAPTLKAMRSNINFGSLNFDLTIGI